MSRNVSSKTSTAREMGQRTGCRGAGDETLVAVGPAAGQATAGPTCASSRSRSDDDLSPQVTDEHLVQPVVCAGQRDLAVDLGSQSACDEKGQHLLEFVAGPHRRSEDL